MAGPNIPGLNEKVMRQMMQRGNSSNRTRAAGLAEDEYMNYKKMASPALKKMMWPSIALSLLDPTTLGPISKGISKISPKAGNFLEGIAPSLGPLGALGYLGPKVISEGMKSRRHAYEKTQPRMGGIAGNTLHGLEAMSSLNYLMKLPGWASVLAGAQSKTLLGKIPRIENWLTGTGKNVIAGKGGAAVAGGGILNSLYGGLKTGVDKLSRGQISGAMSSAVKKGGIGGVAASGAGLLDKGISGLLSSPLGLGLGIAGLQVGLSIYKSVKMSKLTPTRPAPDKYSKNFYNPAQTNSSLTKILNINPAAKDPQSMGFVLQQKTFMVQQLVVQELMRLNMQVAGFRGEYHSENDFVRQERDKGEKNFGESYGTEIYGEDDRGIIMRGLDKLSHTITKTKNTFDPFTQLTNFAFGLLRGKWILPKTEVNKMAKIYGYDDENKMMKEKSESFGIAMDQTRLLHTPGRAILDMAQTYESKMMALGVVQVDLLRYSLAELMTIRLSGYGIDQNILHRREPGVFKQMMTNLFEKLNPLNLPGVNAIWNLGKATIKGIAAVPKIANKVFEGAKNVLTGGISWLGGESYTKMRDAKELRKASGLEEDYGTRANKFMAIGLPAIQAEMKEIQVEQLESLQNLVQIQTQLLELSGGGYEYQTLKNKQGLLEWDSIQQRWLPPEELKKAKEGRRTAMAGVKEKAFMEGPAGKLMFLFDAIMNPSKAAGFESGLKRQHMFENFFGGRGGVEETLLGQTRTVDSREQIRAAEMSLTSLQPTTAILQSTPEQEEARRNFEFELTKKFQEVLGGSGVIGGLAIGAYLASLPIAGLISAAAGIGYVYSRGKLSKQYKQQTGSSKGYVTPEEELLARFAEAKTATLDQIEAHSIGGLGAGGRTIGPMAQSPQAKMLIELQAIRSYLGESATNNVFTLLDPNQDNVAEVTVVDQKQMPVFVGYTSIKRGQSHMGALYSIQDYLGINNLDNVFTLLSPTHKNPNAPTAEVQMSEHVMETFQYMFKNPPQLIKYAKHAAKGTKRTTGGPYIVGEDGEELVVPPKNSKILTNRETTMQRDLSEIEVKKEKKEESVWKKDVVSLLSGILKKPNDKTKEKEKEKEGIWDFLKNNWKEILAFLGLVGIGAAIFSLISKFSHISDWFEKHGMSTFEQAKMTGRGAVGVGLMAGRAASYDFAGAKLAREAAKASGLVETSKISEMPRESLKITQREPLKILTKAQQEKINLRNYYEERDMARQKVQVEEYNKMNKGKIAESGSPKNMSKLFGMEADAKTGGSVFSKIKGFVSPEITKGIELISATTTKVLGPIKNVISWIGKAFEPLVPLLKGFGRILGKVALPLQIIMSAFDFVGDAIEGYKEGGIAGAIKGFLIGPMKDDMETTLGQVGKYFGLGMLLGTPGGPLGMLAGGLIGAGLGATISALKSVFSEFSAGGIVAGLNNVLWVIKKVDYYQL